MPSSGHKSSFGTCSQSCPMEQREVVHELLTPQLPRVWDVVTNEFCVILRVRDADVIGAPEAIIAEVAGYVVTAARAAGVNRARVVIIAVNGHLRTASGRVTDSGEARVCNFAEGVVRDVHTARRGVAGVMGAIDVIVAGGRSERTARRGVAGVSGARVVIVAGDGPARTARGGVAGVSATLTPVIAAHRIMPAPVIVVTAIGGTLVVIVAVNVLVRTAGGGVAGVSGARVVIVANHWGIDATTINWIARSDRAGVAIWAALWGVAARVSREVTHISGARGGIVTIIIGIATARNRRPDALPRVVTRIVARTIIGVVTQGPGLGRVRTVPCGRIARISCTPIAIITVSRQ